MAESLSVVVAAGDTRRSLEALRDCLAHEIEHGTICRTCGGVSLSPTAALAKQLQDVLRTLAALPSERERSLADDLADRRAARVETADVRERSLGGDGRRRGGRRSG